MHRTIRRPWLLPVALLMALLASGHPANSRAQAPTPGGIQTTSPKGALIVPLNGTTRLQMPTKKPIRAVDNPIEAVAQVRPVVGDPTSVLVVGQQAGVTRITLEDVDGRKETYEVIVQADIEFLRTQLHRAVPTANITPIPTANNTVVLSGTVTRAEDVPIAVSVATTIGFTAVNGMRVGGVQQVQLDVVVAQVSRSQFRRMAFNFLTDSKNFFFGSTVGQAVAEPALVGRGGLFSTAGLLTGAPGSPNGIPTNLLFGVLHNNWGLLGFLQALKDENVLKLMAEPRLVTLSGRPASFLVGGEQAVPVPAGLGQIGVQFEEFGTRLNFLPIVLGNGKIHLEVEPEVSNLDPASGVAIGGTVVPGRVTNRVNTTIELESGQTFVIGGLIQHQVLASSTKTPILGELPFLSVFFNSKAYQETEQEVVIMVTPYLVDAMSCGQKPTILPGQETRSPDDFELFLEGILEAPRGPRQVCQDHHYVAAYKNSPSATVYPCAGGACGGAGCGAGCGASPGMLPAPAMPPAAAPTPAPVTVISAAPATPPAAEEIPAQVTGQASTPAPAAPAESARPVSLSVSVPPAGAESR